MSPDWATGIETASQHHKRYSQKALTRIQEELPKLDMKVIKGTYSAHRAAA